LVTKPVQLHVVGTRSAISHGKDAKIVHKHNSYWTCTECMYFICNSHNAVVLLPAIDYYSFVYRLPRGTSVVFPKIISNHTNWRFAW